MATIFQALRNSAMPKRLVRYALRYVLSKLELLDAEALDLDNLDLAIGRNTILEFRDVGIKLRKLERLLKLPSSFKLRKAKVLLLRATIPVDIYTSPIIIEVDGVDVRLSISDEKDGRASSRQLGTPGGTDGVPNTADLAASFLEQQSDLEKKQLEEALAAETQDLGASISVSDDGSEDEGSLGTGQPFSLPSVVADFLQGIVDRLQIKIRTLTFQLDLDVPVEQIQVAADTVTFQITLEEINVEGVTVQEFGEDSAPIIVPREGKRHISLSNIRAFLVSEANVFSAFARSPSIASPAISRSPAQSDQSPLSRQGSSLAESYENYLAESGQFGSQQYPMEDSEAALEIPYDFSSQQEDEEGEDSPATPRASVFQGFGRPPTLPRSQSEPLDLEEDDPPWASFQQGSTSNPALGETSRSGPYVTHERPETPEPSPSPAPGESSGSESDDDLTQSHIYTHEEAASMYASALSELPQAPSQQPMPGAWDSSPESSPKQVKRRSPPSSIKDTINEDEPATEKIPETAVSPTSQMAQEPQEGDETEGPPKLEEPEEEHQASPPQDETPRGPTRLVKEIVSLRNISIYVPSQHEHLHIHPANPGPSESAYGLARSAGPRLPGAFSVYSAHESIPSSTSHASTPASHEKPKTDHSLEVVLSPIEVRFDASLAFLLATVVSKLLEALKSSEQQPSSAAAAPSSTEKQSEPKSSMPEIKVVAERISFLFLHHLMGVADTPERILNPSAFEFDHEVLLRADIRDLSVLIKKEPGSLSTTTTLINLGKFRFGYANGNILSFDRTDKMGASTRDVFPPEGADVSIELLSGEGLSKTEVTTLALMVQIDLQRLDETFGWFGGLSSFLNMGASMTSSASPSTRTLPPKPKGVHFDTPINPDDRSAASENKVDVRIGGLNVRLIGKECDVVLETSAVKTVARNKGIGIAITATSLSGPYLRNRGPVPPIRVNVEGTRIEYHFVPEEQDLEKLLKLITPSKAQADLEDDELMVDTLLRQRRKGAVLRLTLDMVRVRAGDLHHLACLPTLGDEVARLATVAKYLPEDDRPGLLCLGRAKSIVVTADTSSPIGLLTANLKELNLAQITLPSLVAVGLDQLSVVRNGREELIGSPESAAVADEFVLTARMIGDEIEPAIKIRLHGLAFEYRVPTVMEFLGLGADATPQDFEAELVMSIANLGEQAHATLTRHQPSPPASPLKGKEKAAKPLTLKLGLRNCLLGLNPMGLTSKMTIALTDARLQVVLPKDDRSSAQLEIKKAAILLIDDVSILDSNTSTSRRRQSSVSSRQVLELCARGYVEICYISSARANVSIVDLAEGQKQIDVNLRDDLLVLETCADSTQTLISIANALKPPTPPSKQNKFRTKVMPVRDLLASISAEAFGRPEGDYDFDDDFAIAQELGGYSDTDDLSSDVGQLDIQENYYRDDEVGEKLFDATDSMMSAAASQPSGVSSGSATGLSEMRSKAPSEVGSEDSGLVVNEDWFGKEDQEKGTAQIWNSKKNTYDRAPADIVKQAPLKVAVRDVHVIWNLFDGYDWSRTQDVITKKVHEIEAKAYEKRARAEGVYDEDVEDEEAVIGDFLFNSIYIGIPANRDPRELARAINQELQDAGTETESVATTAYTTSTVRPGGAPRSGKKLKLNRSKRHKVTFELQGVSIDLIAFPAGSGETETSIDVRIKNLDIFDHVPTSTWKKFATYDQDAGEREMGSSMVHLEMLNVRPHKDLAATDIVLRVTVLPMRLHVDQDALDFITRFFEFKDEEATGSPSPSDIPFIQRAEVNPIPVKLDFKPKRVDYAGLRSGRTTEFMNFVILEEARMTLRRAIIYGVSGFDRLGKLLNDIWMPDVRNNQLPGVLAGLAPVRNIVNVGSGFKDLIEIPVREYQKDGRIIRSLSKGATAFVRTTGTELVKLGAKLAVGTQYALQGAEGMLTSQPQHQQRHNELWDEGTDESETEEPKQVSLYADQPTGVLQGLKGGYTALARDLNIARDAIIAVPGAVMESQNAQGVAKAVLKKAPTIIFRPAIGASKAIGQTLMGATNTMDPQNRRRVDEKYKKPH